MQGLRMKGGGRDRSCEHGGHIRESPSNHSTKTGHLYAHPQHGWTHLYPFTCTNITVKLRQQHIVCNLAVVGWDTVLVDSPFTLSGVIGALHGPVLCSRWDSYWRGCCFPQGSKTMHLAGRGVVFLRVFGCSKIFYSIQTCYFCFILRQRWRPE